MTSSNDTPIPKNKFTPSDWLTLASNSKDYLKMMNLAFEHSIFSQVLHNGHIAVELIIKAAISREYKGHPKLHEITKLTAITINDSAILIAINSNPETKIHFNKIYTAWTMHYRYEVLSIDKTDAKNYLNSFSEAYKWIQIKYNI